MLDAVRQLVRSLRLSAREAERRTGLSMAQLFVLQQLAEEPDLSLGELARRTFTDRSSVSVVTSRLVRAGLVARTRSPEDARRARLALTRRGSALLARAPRAGQERLIEAVGRMPMARRRHLGGLLKDLIYNMGAATEPPRLLFDDEEERMKIRLRSLIPVLALVALAGGCTPKPKPAPPAATPTPTPTPVVVTVEPTPTPVPTPSMETIPVDVAEINRRGYLTDAFFDFDKSDIRPDAKESLAGDATWLRKYPTVQFTVEGHCDERGTREYNMALGDRRANAVKEYLGSLGVDGSRIKTVSYGKERPFCTEHDEDCWQKNRRGHFVVTAR